MHRRNRWFKAILHSLPFAISGLLASAQTLHPPVKSGIYATAKPYEAPSTKAMAALLEKIFRESDWKADPNKPAERVPYYASILKNNPPFAQQIIVQLEMGREQLRAGDSEPAIHTFETLRKQSTETHQPLPPEAQHQLGEWLALSYLRLGEQENCMHLHGQKSCVFPLRPSAVHQLPRGAEGAVREFTALLAADPNDNQTRWLLNVAYMQLGRYPSAVPKNYLIPAKLFDSEADIKDFADEATAAGLDLTSHAGGCIMEDFDGDGLLDIMVTSSGPTDQMHLFHNNGNGTFADVTAQAGLLGETGGLNLVLTDYNNDGRPDVLILRGGWWGKYGHYPMSLLRNNGNGTFDDVTAAAGLMTAAPTQTAAWADFDNDGFLDLFVGRESTPNDPNPTQLFHNNHDGTFTDIAPAAGLASLAFVKGVAWGDFNNDGRPDLYLSVLDGHNRLFRNDGPDKNPHSWRFTDVTAQAGVAQQTRSFATWFFDYDNDGWPDIFSAGYSTESAQDVGAFEMGKPTHAETPRLYRNNHDGTFTDVAEVHWPRPRHPCHGRQLRRPGQRRLPRCLSRHRRILLSGPSYPTRCSATTLASASRTSRPLADLAICKRATPSPLATSTERATRTSSKRWAARFPATATRASFTAIPGHGNHSITLMLEGVQDQPRGLRSTHLPHRRSGAWRRKKNLPNGRLRIELWRQSSTSTHWHRRRNAGPDSRDRHGPQATTTQTFTKLIADRTFLIREGESTPHPTRLRRAEKLLA